ncbi:MAG: UbiA family prenyltransferase [Anaerolineales bacterium]
MRQKDYQRAGVPMLPVVRGEKETRRQIWAYTVFLVALTWLMRFLGMAGNLYFAAALLLGLWPLYDA